MTIFLFAINICVLIDKEFYEKTIIYGLGSRFQEEKYLIESEFDIVAYADKNIDVLKKYYDSKSNIKCILPNQISDLEYDYIFVTSTKYLREIVEELTDLYKIPEDKIISDCDMWWNVENSDFRDKWVKKQLETLVPNSRILDAGAGNMRYKEYCRHLDYVSQDFGEYDSSDKTVGLHGTLKWESRKCDILSDITQIPVDDNSFDHILCTEVFEHIKNPLDALKEFSRILKPGGNLFLTAPFCSLTHMAPYYFANGFSRYWYEENLKDNGFEIVELLPYGNWFTYMLQELKRTEYMSERYSDSLSEDDIRSVLRCAHIMSDLEKKDRGSNEVLCFGILVRARKR